MTLLVPIHSPIVTKAVTTPQWPGQLAVPPRAVTRLLAHNFPRSRFLSAQGAERLHARLASLNIAGGAVCDALVAATAVEHGITLATRDRRAVETYRARDIDFELID